MVNAQPRICPGKCDAQNSLGFGNANGLPILGQTTRTKRTCWIGNFTISDDHRVKLKEGEKEINTLILLENSKKLWNMKVTVVPIVIGTLDTVNRWLVQGMEELEIRGCAETIQTIALLRSVKILSVLETWWDFQSLKLLWETISKCWWENLSLKEKKNYRKF